MRRAFDLKQLLPVMLAALLLFPACSSHQDESSTVINWLPYAEGLKSAGEQGKKVFLYFRADW